MAWDINLRHKMQSSVSEIRRRLLFLLLRAFVIVLFLWFLFFVVTVSYFVTSSSSVNSFNSVNVLDEYYLAKGSWAGVESVFASADDFWDVRFCWIMSGISFWTKDLMPFPLWSPDIRFNKVM